LNFYEFGCTGLLSEVPIRILCMSHKCTFGLAQFLLLNLHYLHIALLHFDYNGELYTMLHCVTDSVQLRVVVVSLEHTHCVSVG